MRCGWSNPSRSNAPGRPRPWWRARPCRLRRIPVQLSLHNTLTRACVRCAAGIWNNMVQQYVQVRTRTELVDQMRASRRSSRQTIENRSPITVTLDPVGIVERRMDSPQRAEGHVRATECSSNGRKKRIRNKSQVFRYRLHRGDCYGVHDYASRTAGRRTRP
jgi:hypothetical protein